MADAALGYHQARRGEGAANAVMAEAERVLNAAKLGGDIDAIRQAEANLQQARKAREGALMGGIAAGETLLATAEAIGQKRQGLGQVEKLRQLASQRGQQLLSVLQDPRATAGEKREALAALVRLAQAGTAYEQAVATGDPSAMRTARGELEAVNEMLRTRPPGSVQVPPRPRSNKEPSTSAPMPPRKPQKQRHMGRHPRGLRVQSNRRAAVDGRWSQGGRGRRPSPRP